MEKTILQVKPSFYTYSPYAKYIINEKKDDSYGLVFNEFVHEIGTILEVDIIYEQLNRTNWILADNQHMQMVLNKNDNGNEQFEFIPKTLEGEKLIINMSEQILKENSEYISIY